MDSIKMDVSGIVFSPTGQVIEAPPKAPEGGTGEREKPYDKMVNVIINKDEKTDFVSSRLDIHAVNISELSEKIRLIKTDDDTTRNRVTNLLQRTEPRIALLESVLIEAGFLAYNDKGEIVKAPPVEPVKPKKKKRNVTRPVTKRKAVKKAGKR